MAAKRAGPSGKRPGQGSRADKGANQAAATPGSAPRLRKGRPLAPANHLPVVAAFGASAGGLEALRKVLLALPPDTGMAFVVIQHLDPTHESMLVELLARHTPMRVLQAADGTQIEPNRIYVIPPQVELSVRAGKLHVTHPRAPRGARMPFDIFLRSLAEEYRERAICVVLSGTGADGSVGLKAVSEQGGLVIVQDPADASYDGMPRSAIATGVVNLVLPAAKIPQAMLQYGLHPYIMNSGRAGMPTADEDRALTQILELLREQTAFDFSRYKQPTLLRRVRRRMAAAGIAEMKDYVELLRGKPSEAEPLAKDLLVHVTTFFRDPEAFETLSKTVIAELLRERVGDAPIRAWVAGSSTGEEAYSLGILFLEAFAEARQVAKLQIFASDISADAVAYAREGVYPESIKADVSPERLQRYFTRENHGFRVSRDLRDSIIFTVQDLLTDPPFSRLDLVTCRNVLIYLKPDEQEKILTALHFALREGGFLFLGGSETIGRLTDRFEPVGRVQRIFRRIGPRRPREPTIAPRLGERARVLWPRVLGGLEIKRPNLAEIAQRTLLDAYAPAAVLINRNYQGYYFSGVTDKYLRVPSGEASRDVLGMLREGLTSKFRTAVRQALRDQAPVTVSGARVKRNGGSALVGVTARPVSYDDEALLLVTFVDEPEPGAPRAPETPAEISRATLLEQELDTTRKELESTIRDLEATNQELTSLNEEAVSVNEEFQSTNEELETSKEELQSLNEELTTVNSQLQEALEGQRKTASDLQNLVKSSGLATLFLDERLNIRYFTPAVAPLFNLIDTDVGRPLGDLAIRFSGGDFLADARNVLISLEPHTREVQSVSGGWYACNTSPYRGQENEVEGVVITLSDITGLKRSEQASRAAQVYAESILNTIPAPQIVLDEQIRVVSASRAFYRFLGATPEDTLGRRLVDVDARHLDTPAMNAFIERATSEEDATQQDIELDLPGLGHRRLAVTARAIAAEAGAPRRLLMSFDDITIFRDAEEQLGAAKRAAEQANLVKSRFLAIASHDLRQPLQTLNLLRALLSRKTSDPESQRLLARFGEMLDVVSDMLDPLLDINRLEIGGVEPEIVDFRIGEIIERLGTEFALHAKEVGIGYRTVGCGLAVRSDPRLLEQMLRNLLWNAIKFTRQGRILFGCRRRGDRLRIEIWDTGPGIPEAELKVIFEEFRTGTAPPPERGRGLGLGLSIVQRLADLLGHTIDVRSELGKGSVFSIEVPIAESAGETPKPIAIAPAATATQAQRTILLVEDDPAVRDSLEMLFSGSGFRTLAATGGTDALALVADGAQWPDIILVDFTLPGGTNGVEVAEAVRTATRQNVPVVVLTADPSLATRRTVSERGYPLLNKPVEPDELLGLVQRLLGDA